MGGLLGAVDKCEGPHDKFRGPRTYAQDYGGLVEVWAMKLVNSKSNNLRSTRLIF